MKTTYQVKVAYSRAKNQANEIDDIADSIEKKRIKLTDERIKLTGYWRGTNANNYRDKMVQRENELSAIVADLRRIASTIRQVAKNSHDADMRAIKLVQQNSNKK